MSRRWMSFETRECGGGSEVLSSGGSGISVGPMRARRREIWDGNARRVLRSWWQRWSTLTQGRGARRAGDAHGFDAYNVRES